MPLDVVGLQLSRAANLTACVEEAAKAGIQNAEDQILTAARAVFAAQERRSQEVPPLSPAAVIRDVTTSIICGEKLRTEPLAQGPATSTSAGSYRKGIRHGSNRRAE